jgi:hypothetical protein
MSSPRHLNDHSIPDLNLEEAAKAFVNGEITAEQYEAIEARYAPNYVEGARALIRSRSDWKESTRRVRRLSLRRLLSPA